MKEQPLPSDSEDLFGWGEKHNPQVIQSKVVSIQEGKEDESLEKTCAQCELGYLCPKHPKEITALVPTSFIITDQPSSVHIDEDSESSNRIADHEAEIAHTESLPIQRASDEDLRKFFQEVKDDLNQQAS